MCALQIYCQKLSLTFEWVRFFFEVRGGGSPFLKLPFLSGFFEFMLENFRTLHNFEFFSDANTIFIIEGKLWFQFFSGTPPKNFGQNDITLIHPTYT